VLLTHSLFPSSRGITPNTLADVVVISLQTMLRSPAHPRPHRDELAAVIVEAGDGRGGLYPG